MASLDGLRALAEQFAAKLVQKDQSCINEFDRLCMQIRECCDNIAVNEIFEPDCLEAVDRVILWQSARKIRPKLQAIAKSPWHFRPYQVRLHFGMAIESFRFIDRLRSLCKMIDLENGLQMLHQAQQSRLGGKACARGSNRHSLWMPLDVDQAILAISPGSQRSGSQTSASSHSTSRSVSPCELETQASTAASPLAKPDLCPEQHVAYSLESTVEEMDFAQPTTNTNDNTEGLKNSISPVEPVILQETFVNGHATNKAMNGYYGAYVDEARRDQEQALASLQTGMMLNNYAIDILLRILNNEGGTLILEPSVATSSGKGTLKRLRGLKPHHKILVIPVHVNNNHWMIGFANRFTMFVDIYDPLHLSENITRATTALQILMKLVPGLKTGDRAWQFRSLSTTLQQSASDGVNCGIYCIVMASLQMSHFVVPKELKIHPAFWRRIFVTLLSPDTQELTQSFHIHDGFLWERDILQRLVEWAGENEEEAQISIETARKCMGDIREQFHFVYLDFDKILPTEKFEKAIEDLYERYERRIRHLERLEVFRRRA